MHAELHTFREFPARFDLLDKPFAGEMLLGGGSFLLGCSCTVNWLLSYVSGVSLAAGYCCGFAAVCLVDKQILDALQ